MTTDLAPSTAPPRNCRTVPGTWPASRVPRTAAAHAPSARAFGRSSRRRSGRLAVVAFAVAWSPVALSCPTCAPEVDAALRELGWLLPGAGLTATVLVCAALVAVLPRRAPAAARPLERSGLCLGVGLGGFIDGIVFHQILQWHGMVSARLLPIDFVAAKVNMFWDGIFHAGVWLFTAAGVALLWNAAGAGGVVLSRRRFVAALLLGWATFNLVEGVVDHHLLRLHRVHEFAVHAALWNWAFLLLSAALAAGAARELRRARAS